MNDVSVPLDWERIKEGADELGISANTFQQWKSRGVVPHRWRLPLIELGKATADTFRGESAT